MAGTFGRINSKLFPTGHLVSPEVGSEEEAEAERTGQVVPGINIKLL